MLFVFPKKIVSYWFIANQWFTYQKLWHTIVYISMHEVLKKLRLLNIISDQLTHVI